LVGVSAAQTLQHPSPDKLKEVSSVGKGAITLRVSSFGPPTNDSDHYGTKPKKWLCYIHYKQPLRAILIIMSLIEAGRHGNISNEVHIDV
jgi:hypothetical protein